MINKSNQSMCQWITLLEQKNAQLEKQNAQLQYNLINLQNKFDETLKKLETRITDFTDHWHPLMMQNINRIKNELVETVEKKQYQIKSDNTNEIDYETKYKELENKLESLKNKFDETGLEGHVVVGYNCLKPIIINKKIIDTVIPFKTDFYSLINQYLKNHYEFAGRYKSEGKPFLKAIELLKNKCSTFDINMQSLNSNNFTFIDDNFNDFHICQTDINDKSIDFNFNGPKVSVKSIKKLLSVLEPDVKLTFHNQETYNGIPVRKYIESFF